MKGGNLNTNQTGFELRDWIQIIAWIQTISGLLMLAISVAVGLLLGQQISIINSPHNSSSGEVETDFILFASSELKICLIVAIMLTAAFLSSGLILFIGVDKSHPWIYVKTSLISFLLLFSLALFVIFKRASFAESLNNFSQISLVLGVAFISALSPSIILLYQNYCQQNNEPNIEIMTSIFVTKTSALNVEKQNPVPWKKIFLKARHYFQSKFKNQNEACLPIPLIHGQNQSQVLKSSNDEY